MHPVLQAEAENKEQLEVHLDQQRSLLIGCHLKYQLIYNFSFLISKRFFLFISLDVSRLSLQCVGGGGERPTERVSQDTTELLSTQYSTSISTHLPPISHRITKKIGK